MKAEEDEVRSFDGWVDGDAALERELLEAVSPVKTRFLALYGAGAKASEVETGVPALVTLGQAAFESGWGEHVPRFNFFGIKAKASDPPETRQLLETTEVINGKKYRVKAWFRAYPDAATSFADHGHFLRDNPRYAGAFAHKDDAYKFAAAVAAAGYATDQTYGSTLAKIMRGLEAAGGP